jgi:hypothetical protein
MLNPVIFVDKKRNEKLIFSHSSSVAFVGSGILDTGWI